MEFLSLEQVKKLSVTEAADYCNTLREYLVETVKESGGHLASNLGVAEISIACARVFDLPDDKIIYDVGHQCYVHKLITGRYFDATTLRAFNGYSGFTKRSESEYDAFGAGHSSTALSAALGFAKANRINKKANYSVAVIGDGAFCTGMTFEALNNVEQNDRLIIILNDNEMSISKNVGAMSEYLLKMRTTKRYLHFKNKTKNFFGKLPLIGRPLSRALGSIKDFIKRAFLKSNFFEDLGIEYLGPVDGNDLSKVELLLREAKRRTSPVLVHFLTKKGKGYDEAELDPDRFHAVSKPGGEKRKTFSEFFGEYMVEEAEKDPCAVAITAAMCDGTGLGEFSKKYPDRFFDVGICEEHAITFAAALSAAGINPYFAVYSTFFQRAYDQLLHDGALQDLKITLALDRAGFSSYDGPTHHGVFDVSLLLSVPGVTLYSPTSFAEMEYSFEEGKKLPRCVAVRYPKGSEIENIKNAFPTLSDMSLDEEKESKVMFITYGNVTGEVLLAKKCLEKLGYSACVLKLLKLKPLDYKLIKSYIDKTQSKYVFFVEEGIKSGGVGEAVFSNLSCLKGEIIAIDDKFVPFGDNAHLYDYAGLSAEKIVEKVSRWIKK